MHQHCRHVFEKLIEKVGCELEIKWALPGKERQDSVFNGFSEICDRAALVAIHDSARPLISAEDFRCESLCHKDWMNRPADAPCEALSPVLYGNSNTTRCPQGYLGIHSIASSRDIAAENVWSHMRCSMSL